MDSNFHAATEVTFHHEPASDKKRIWKTTIVLSILTIIELSLGLLMYATDLPAWVDMFIKGVIVILTLAKAFYIISIFMHLGDEIRNMIMTLAMPVLLFVWFIGAFLWDGGSYRSLRNRYDTYYQEKSLQQHEVNASDTTKHPLH
jgi:cytochrome c oxidase subunit IV